MNILALKAYVENNYEGQAKKDLMEYIGSNYLLEDIEHILSNDDTITEDFAAICAVEQRAEYLLNEE